MSLKYPFILIGFFLLITSFSLTAKVTKTKPQPNNELKTACEISGGNFSGSEGANWTCCWTNWGCYGCTSNNCKIKCHNERCRKANNLPEEQTQAVKGLAPAGNKAPVVPKN